TGILKGKQNPCFVRATSTTAGEHDGDPAFKILPKLGRIIRQTVAKNRTLAFQQEVDLIFELECWVQHTAVLSEGAFPSAIQGVRARGGHWLRELFRGHIRRR